MGIELSVFDTVLGFQVEPGDHVRFTLDNVTHSGIVLDVEDKGDKIDVTLDDDTEGDSETFELDFDDDVEIVGYAEMDIAV